MTRKTTLLLLVLLLLPSVASARIYLDISSPDFQKMPLAVPYLVDRTKPDVSSAVGKEMAKILGQGFEFHGFLAVVPPETYGGKQDAAWAEHGVDYTVLAQFERTPTETIIELRFNDVQNNRLIFGKRYRGSWESRKLMLFKFCDEVIAELTGEPGICLSKIAFVSDRSSHKEIYVTDVLGQEVKQVTNYGNIALSPRFTVDGKKLFYTSYHKGNPDLYLTDLFNTALTVPVSSHKGLNMAPAVSPDGRQIVVTLSKDGNPDLYLMSKGGVVLKQLTQYSGINVSPSWSPDGKEMAFVSDRSGSPQIYIMDIDTLRTRRLTYVGNYNTSPSWSPKGGAIAYAGFYEGGYQIFTTNVDGAAPPLQLTTDWGDHESPSWAPDGRQIVFTLNRNNIQQLCKIFKNGSEPTPLLRMNGNQSFPQWSPRLEM